MEIGYARVSTTKQDLERQIHALEAVGIEASRIFVDKKSGTTIDRPGLRAALGYARSGDVLVVHTLDRLGRTVRDTLNLIHDLAGGAVGVDVLEFFCARPRQAPGPITARSIKNHGPIVGYCRGCHRRRAHLRIRTRPVRSTCCEPLASTHPDRQGRGSRR